MKTISQLEREYNVAVANGLIITASRIARTIGALRIMKASDRNWAEYQSRPALCPECEQPGCEGPE